MQFRGAHALVTGANRGLGSHFVEALLARGAERVTLPPVRSGLTPPGELSVDRLRGAVERLIGPARTIGTAR
jgi:NAD(P)-dependent dehydrogenase (short-subunit alcohol dehydrogenase family)